jgi:hypothetical protein
MRHARTRVLAVTSLVLLVVSTAWAAGPNTAATADTGSLAGFWLGIWQGLISPITFLISLFNDNINIYEVNNNGNWYNFGFMLGICIVFSGAPGSRYAQSRRPQRAKP